MASTPEQPEKLDKTRTREHPEGEQERGTDGEETTKSFQQVARQVRRRRRKLLESLANK